MTPADALRETARIFRDERDNPADDALANLLDAGATQLDGPQVVTRPGDHITLLSHLDDLGEALARLLLPEDAGCRMWGYGEWLCVRTPVERPCAGCPDTAKAHS